MEEELKPMDAEQLREYGHRMVDFVADYYKTVEDRPVLSQVEPGYLRKILPDSAPVKPETFENVLSDVKTKIVPGVTHWQSPNYFAYFPSNSSTAGFLGEMLSACFNIVGFSWITSPAATELEMVVLDWFAKMLKLPDFFLSTGQGGGVIQESLSDSRDSPRNVKVLKTDSSTNYALSPDLLREETSRDIASGFIPFFACASVGTTSSTAIDPILELANVTKDQNALIQSLSTNLEFLQNKIVAPRTFALVCFCVLQSDSDDRINELNSDLLHAVNSTGKIFITHTVLSGKYILRFAIGDPLTEKRHVDAAWKIIQYHATSLLQKYVQTPEA